MIYFFREIAALWTPTYKVGSDLQDVTNVYIMGKVLGRGQFGTTRLATQKSTGKDFACKSIAKRKLL